MRFTYIQPQKLQNIQEIYIWDLDKTYLDTKLESLRGLFKVFMEKPNKKKNIPGTSELVRCLQDSYQQRYESEEFPIFFITASPPQMEVNIIEKLNLDGIHPMGLFCKDNLKNLHPRRLWKLSKQVGYKLQALLEMRVDLFSEVKQTLWGDDSESDVIIYNLYSDICSRRISNRDVEKILKYFQVSQEQIRTLINIQERIPIHDPVEKIYINLAEDTDADYYLKFGRRVLPTFNSFQTSLDLFQDKKLGLRHVVNIARDLLENYGYTTDLLEKSLDDLVRRQVIEFETVDSLVPGLVSAKIINSGWVPSVKTNFADAHAVGSVSDEEVWQDPWIQENIDYINNFR